MTLTAEKNSVCIDEIQVGMMASMVKTVTEHDIQMFAEVSTDHNPVHLDEAYAQGTMFKGRIAHGMLSAGFISALLGEKLPGHGTIYMGQTLKFLAPVRLNDTVKAEVKVTAIDREKRRVTLETLCSVGDTVVIKGEAVVLAPKC